MSQTLQTRGFVSAALQQWVDTRTHLSNAIQAYIVATKSLESACTPFSIKSTPGVLDVIENNLAIMQHEEFDLHRVQAALKKKRNSYISPIFTLPSELLAYVFTTTVAPSRSCASNEHIKRNLSRVCSQWRHIALDVCPFWSWSTLTFRIDETSEGKMAEADMVLGRSPDLYAEVPIRRQLDLGFAPYIQKTLDAIAPYIKQLRNLELATDDVEQLRLFFDFWLEKGSLGSVTELNLAVENAARVFAETNSHLSDRFSQCLGHVLNFSIYSVGLDWSSVAFDKLQYMALSKLPSSCCPTLVQLARILSTCPSLWSLDLECITFPACSDPAPKPAELGSLNYLYITEVDLGSVLPILSPRGSELHLKLRSPIDDNSTLESLYSFVSRVSIHDLELTLSEIRSDQTLGRLLHHVSSPLLGLRNLTLKNMNLRDLELSDLAMRSFVHDSATLVSALVGNTSVDSQLRTLLLWNCTIHASPETLHDAFFPLSWHTLKLSICSHSPAAQGADSAAEVLVGINPTSEFGIRLSELLPDRVVFGYW